MNGLEKRCKTLLLSQIRYLDEDILYLYFYEDCVVYQIKNQYFPDVLIGDKSLVYFFRKRPASVREYIEHFRNQDVEEQYPMQKIIKNIYSLLEQGVINLEPANTTNQYNKGEMARVAREDNIREIQAESLCLLKDHVNQKIIFSAVDTRTIFSLQFMRKMVFSFKFDYLIIDTDEIVIENVGKGISIIRFLSINKSDTEKRLMRIIEEAFNLNEFCNQIRIELEENRKELLAYLEKCCLFRKYMNAIEDEDDNIKYGYQIFRRSLKYD